MSARTAVVLVALGLALLGAGCSASGGASRAAAPGAVRLFRPAEQLKPDPGYRSRVATPYAWAQRPAQIAHGMGGVEGWSSTSSYEAFKYNYDRGYRIFEVDLMLSTDGRLVARHDWEPYLYAFLGQHVADPKKRLSRAEFVRLPIHRTLSPMTIEDVVALMRAYPDITVVTDTKSKNPADIAAAMNGILAAIGRDKMLADRFAIQIYNEPMYEQVRKTGAFRNIIYTLYQLEGTPEGAVAFAKARGIKVVAIPDTLWSPGLVRLMTDDGIIPAVYTVNDRAVAKKLRASGVRLIYSDFLPAQLPQ